MTPLPRRKPTFDMKNCSFLAGMFLLAGQWAVLRFLHPGLHDPWVPLLPGIAIFAAAYLLSWSAEVAQHDIPPALALALLALVAVLPEYAVDIYFAWTAGKDPSYIPYATANMTGANRLLIGVGWPVIVFVYWLKTRKSEVKLIQRLDLETAVLLAATLYSFVIPLKKTLSLVDAFFLIGLFLWYFSRIVRGKVEEPEELEGPPGMISSWPPITRRLTAILLFLFAGFVIWAAAEPFAEGILDVGLRWGIEEFVLVQWLAPLASESPEFIVAVLFALRMKPNASFNTLISSKVNQWTLLVGMLPVAYFISHALSGQSGHSMALDARQVEEIFLTGAQSLFAVVVLSDRRFSLKEALALFVLFFLQAAYPAVEKQVGVDSVHVRLAFAWIYMGLTGGIVITSAKFRENLIRLFGAFRSRVREAE
jgi:cation:H+ antiporter